MEQVLAEPETRSTARRVAGATGIMMAAILASRLLGLVRDAVISYQLGRGAEADIYVGAFRIPDVMFYLIAGGALSSAFIPVFTELITKDQEKEAWRVFSTVATVMFVVVTTFVILAEIFAVPFTNLVNMGFSREKVLATASLTRIVLPAQVCFFMGGLLMGTQYSRQQFRVPAMGPVVYNIGIILGGVLLVRWLGAAGLCWGALVGAVAGNLLMQLWAVVRAGMQFHVSFAWHDPHVMKVWKLMIPVVLGISLPQVSIWVNGYYAAHMANGALATLGYANRLMQVPLALFAQAMAVAIFPTLSAQAALRQYDQLRSTASEGIRALMFLTIPASVLMILLATPIVQLLLQQGQKFRAADTAHTAPVLVFYCLGIFAWSAQSILARIFYAMHDSVSPVVVGSLATVAFIPMNRLFSTTLGMGVPGLAMATTVAAVLNMVAMLFVLGRKLHGIELGALVTSMGKAAVASAACGLACRAVQMVLHGPARQTTAAIKLHALLTITAGSVVGIAAFVLVAAALRSNELALVRRALRRA